MREAFEHSMAAGILAKEKGALAEAEYYLRVALTAARNRRCRIAAAEELLVLLSSVKRFTEASELAPTLRQYYKGVGDERGVEH